MRDASVTDELDDPRRSKDQRYEDENDYEPSAFTIAQSLLRIASVRHGLTVPSWPVDKPVGSNGRPVQRVCLS